MIEYVSLGDFQTAVGFLLASTPEKSIRYYRDALCTLALAVSAPHLGLAATIRHPYRVRLKTMQSTHQSMNAGQETARSAHSQVLEVER